MKFLAFAVARGLNAVYFIGSCVYALLSYSSFAYEQFIRPQLIAWLPEVVALHHLLFWLTVLVTLPTLLPPILRGTMRQRIAAGTYLAANVGLGLWLAGNPVMALAGPNTRTLVIAILCLVPLFALAVVDHVTAGRSEVQPIDERRLFISITAAMIVIWLAYVLLIPWYIPRTVGVDLSWAALLLAVAVSLASHLLVFGLIYLVAAAALSLATLLHHRLAEYWMLSILWVGALAFVINRVVAQALSFQQAESWVLSGWLSVVLVAIWSGLAWHRGGTPPAHRDAIDLWFGPISGHLAIAIPGVIAIPLLALGLRTAVAQFDWNFMIQKLGVGLIWGLALGWASLVVGRGVARMSVSRRTCDLLAGAMVAIGLAGTPVATRAAAWSGDARLEPEFVLDRYAALDSSYQLLRGLIKTNSGADAEFYRFLKSHSTLGKITIAPIDVKMVETFQPAAATPPDIYLFIIDSLRHDYLSPYNPAVTFTPATQAFAAESVVFERAFTRYGGTALSVPAMWTGGMLLHKQFVLPFSPMNSLEKLLDATGYRRFISDDHLIDLFKKSPDTTLLDRQIDEMDHTVCATVQELQSQIDAMGTDRRPVFAMTRPLQLHTARLIRDAPVAASAYPGFSPNYAAQVAAMDRCLGDFIGYLKRTGRYDRSVVVLTSDHGESLGEDGRFGHTYTLYPEVLRIPLIIRLPPALAATLTTDRSSVALSTDITPTLYALAGQAPRNLGVLYGAPLFTPIDRPIPDRRRDSFLISSSYGPVHALLRHNGRTLYIADAIQGIELAYEMRANGQMERLTVTDVMRTLNRELMRDHIGKIAAEYRFTPAP